jgi:hypothetical protein
MHRIQYRNTDQGQKTRLQLITILQRRDGLTRKDLVNEGLTYDQVRRQTKNLSIEGAIESRLEAGQRRYYLRQNFKALVSSFIIVLAFGWSVPVLNLSSGTDHDFEQSSPSYASDRCLS